jgi:hypothetical protein
MAARSPSSIGWSTCPSQSRGVGNDQAGPPPAVNGGAHRPRADKDPYDNEPKGLRDNLDENGSGSRSVKRRPVAKR